jgi:hypothetical protein
MSQYVRNKTELIALACQIQAGESREFTLPWDVTRADARDSQLQLGQYRSGGTFRVEVIGQKLLRVTATEAVRGFTLSGGKTIDIRSMDGPLRT